MATSSARAGSFTLSRDQVRDQGLSIDAVGLLAWLSSHTDDFIARLSEARIRAAVHVGEFRLRRMLRELIAAGYLLRQQITDAVGLITGVRYSIDRKASPQQVLFGTSRDDGFSDQPGDLGKHDVSAGRRQDGFSDQPSSTREDQQEGENPPTPRAPAKPRTPKRGTMPKDPHLPGLSKPAMTMAQRAGDPDLSKATCDQRIREVVRTVVAEWLQRCNRRPPTSIIRQVEEQIEGLVIDAVDTDDIRRGCARWMGTGLPPSVLPSEVNAAMNASAGQRRAPRGYVERDGQLVTERTAHSLDMLARMQALDEADRAAIGGAL